MLIKDLPPICPGTEEHFEDHDFGGEMGVEVVYWPSPWQPRFWSHDSDYPWGLNGHFSKYEREHIASRQIVAWNRTTGGWKEVAVSKWEEWEKLQT